MRLSTRFLLFLFFLQKSVKVGDRSLETLGRNTVIWTVTVVFVNGRDKKGRSAAYTTELPGVSPSPGRRSWERRRLRGRLAATGGRTPPRKPPSVAPARGYGAVTSRGGAETRCPAAGGDRLPREPLAAAGECGRGCWPAPRPWLGCSASTWRAMAPSASGPGWRGRGPGAPSAPLSDVDIGSGGAGPGRPGGSFG